MVNEHDLFQLECQVRANPIPVVVWLKSREGKVMTNLDTSTRISISAPKNFKEAIYISTLTISRAVPNDRGEYVCEASNSVVSDTTIIATFMLEITGELNSKFVDLVKSAKAVVNF